MNEGKHLWTKKISIHAPLARCDAELILTGFPKWISIHAPLARCDLFTSLIIERRRYFNPRTSCEVRLCAVVNCKISIHFNPRTSCEVRLNPRLRLKSLSAFQSTHLLRGATRRSLRCSIQSQNFNPRTSCEVRLRPMVTEKKRLIFQSTHLLRGATVCNSTVASSQTFQSTHLLRGATDSYRMLESAKAISIHAPLARCDVLDVFPQ